MDAIQTAVLQTLIYADIFDFALRPDEVHRYLLHQTPVSMEQVHAAICSPQVQAHTYSDSLYIALSTNPQAIQRRHQIENYADHLWERAARYAEWLAAIPFVEMVALTGAIAMRNPGSAQDDFDYLIVTHPGRVWFVRACAILLVRVARVFGDEICPNYILASDQLLQKRQDLFVAHELAQMRPLFGGDIYRKMLAINTWALSMLPNIEPLPDQPDQQKRLKSALEWFLQGYPGTVLDRLEYWRRGRKLRAQAKQTASAAIINQAQVKGHFQDHGARILEQYEMRLRDFNL